MNRDKTLKARIVQRELKQLRAEAITIYKQFMPNLYRKYKNLDQAQISLAVAEAIMHHANQKAFKSLRRKVRQKTVKVPVLIDPTQPIEAEEKTF